MLKSPDSHQTKWGSEMAYSAQGTVPSWRKQTHWSLLFLEGQQERGPYSQMIWASCWWQSCSQYCTALLYSTRGARPYLQCSCLLLATWIPRHKTSKEFKLNKNKPTRMHRPLPTKQCRWTILFRTNCSCLNCAWMKFVLASLV